MREEIIQTFQSKIFALNKEDPTYEARKEYFENKMDEELDTANSFEKSKNRMKRKFKVDKKSISIKKFLIVWTQEKQKW